MKYADVEFIFINNHFIHYRFLNYLSIVNVQKHFVVFFFVGVDENLINKVNLNLIIIYQAFSAFLLIFIVMNFSFSNNYIVFKV